MLSNLISQLKQANAEDKYYDVLAEVPRVREDFGYPPLVTPTSQIVGTQAVMNVLVGERYKMVTKESKGMLRGEYGQLPGKVNEEVRKKCIGDDKVITCRPPTSSSRSSTSTERSSATARRARRTSSPMRCSRPLRRSSSSGATTRTRKSLQRLRLPRPRRRPLPLRRRTIGPRTLYVEDLTNGVF